MELTSALERRSIQVLTPYKPDAWESALHDTSLLERFSNIPLGLRFGFRIDFPNITRIQAPPNAPSINNYHKQFCEIIQNEITKGRYIGPYPLEIIHCVVGPYQSSPLSIIPKPGRPGKFRLVQNFSFPLLPSPPFPNPSINSFISAIDFPTTWGNFSIVYLLATRLPPDSEVATRDVAEAYRTVPLHPSQWPAAIICTSPSHGCIDTCTAFGATPSAGSYGHVADAAAEIFRHRGIGPLDKWVDDHIFFRIQTQHMGHYNQLRSDTKKIITLKGTQQSGSHIWFSGSSNPDGSTDEFSEDVSHPIRDLSHSSPRSPHDACFTYSMADIDDVSHELGIPWELSKDQPFSSSTMYIGFLWWLNDHTVELSPEKCQKYLIAINNWWQHPTHRLEDVQKLYGKLLHTTSLIPAGRAYLTGFERMLAVCIQKLFMLHRPDKVIAEDLNWWSGILSEGRAIRTISPPPTFIDLSAFSDASSTIGIAIVIGERWRAWRLLPGWRTLNGK